MAGMQKGSTDRVAVPFVGVSALEEPSLVGGKCVFMPAPCSQLPLLAQVTE